MGVGGEGVGVSVRRRMMMGVRKCFLSETGRTVM